jgi:tetratricopeptide (TPR) repeat protein
MRIQLAVVTALVVALAGCAVTPTDISDMSRAAAEYKRGSDGAARVIVARLMGQKRSDPGRAALVLQSVCMPAHKFKDASELASRALSVADKSKSEGMAELYTVLGMAKHEMGDTDGAIAAYKEALRNRGDDHTAMNNLGYAYAEVPPAGANLAEALELTTRAVKLARRRGVPDAQVGVFMDSVGWVQYRMGRSDEAIVTLTEAVELCPTQADVPYHLARAYLAVGRRGDAVVMLRRARAMSPGLDAANRLLDSLLADTGAPAETTAPGRP